MIIRRFACLILLLTLCVPLPHAAADAAPLQPLQQSYETVTRTETTVYSLADRTEAIDTLPAGSAVRVASAVAEWTIIDYNGGTGYGVVRTECLLQPDRLPVPPYTPSSALTPDYTIPADVLAQADEAQLPAEYNDAPVTVIRLGTVTSYVISGTQIIPAESAALRFSADAQDGRSVAILHAPESGQASLREKPSDSSRRLQYVRTGLIVAVLSHGNTWSQIHTGDAAGYVLTRCLRFPDAAAVPTGEGVLSIGGSSTGSAMINVRATPKRDSAKAAEWPTGTPVTVFGTANGWVEIEAQGVHGYVMDDYITIVPED